MSCVPFTDARCCFDAAIAPWFVLLKSFVIVVLRLKLHPRRGRVLATALAFTPSTPRAYCMGPARRGMAGAYHSPFHRKMVVNE